MVSSCLCVEIKDGNNISACFTILLHVRMQRISVCVLYYTPCEFTMSLPRCAHVGDCCVYTHVVRGLGTAASRAVTMQCVHVCV